MTGNNISAVLVAVLVLVNTIIAARTARVASLTKTAAERTKRTAEDTHRLVNGAHDVLQAKADRLTDELAAEKAKGTSE